MFKKLMKNKIINPVRLTLYDSSMIRGGSYINSFIVCKSSLRISRFITSALSARGLRICLKKS
jgi:hypothetical protein